ncbi:ectoine/hydroxyectoine ABC transporter substrate-binding protein EhuB [Streptantibioticus rubrisoli]|uniref:Ectoine/hydroxyectoine ABC transporter substrate-binding protein EhuB n=1 Tax=Streptantibioticus rubrisoli TaxID=1387313 RepID=A0ABT1PAL4_9ACTN|nr:ectoine/hydroxyectoine ABC transporter substrate-binding protein EhuB [Streptantibioticus rubrisoli]MCQ4042404.1 ectoine/hydroxyectoine ABC transporter substrate-binding protein EhuB [Streptantibioticus rubrisoli]
MSYQQHTHRATTPGLTRRGLLGALGLTALATGCSRVSTADATDGGNLLERLREQGTVRLGIAGEIPFAYIDRDGRLTGEAPTVAKAIFTRLGVPHTQPVPIDFGSLIPGLRSNQFDVIAAGMFINPTRCAQVLFSDPDYQVQEALIVPRGNPKKLRTYADIARTGASMGVATGGIEIQYAKSYGVPSGKIAIYNDQLSGLEGIEAGRMDCFAGTSLTLRNLLATGSHPKVEMTEPFIPVVGGKKQYGAGGYGFRPGETRLRDAFNSQLHRLRDSGELLRLIRPFGFTETESTTLTARELCG